MGRTSRRPPHRILRVAARGLAPLPSGACPPSCPMMGIHSPYNLIPGDRAKYADRRSGASINPYSCPKSFDQAAHRSLRRRQPARCVRLVRLGSGTFPSEKMCLVSWTGVEHVVARYPRALRHEDCILDIYSLIHLLYQQDEYLDILQWLKRTSKDPMELVF